MYYALVSKENAVVTKSISRSRTVTQDYPNRAWGMSPRDARLHGYRVVEVEIRIMNRDQEVGGRC